MASAGPVWVAAPPSDDDEQDFMWRARRFPTAQVQPDVYVVEDDDVQILNVLRHEQQLRHRPPPSPDAALQLDGVGPFPQGNLPPVDHRFDFGGQFAPAHPHRMHHRVEIPAWEPKDMQAWQHGRGDPAYFGSLTGMPAAHSTEPFAASHPVPQGILGLPPRFDTPLVGGGHRPQERRHRMPAGGRPPSHKANRGVWMGEPMDPPPPPPEMLIDHYPPYMTGRSAIQERHSKGYNAADLGPPLKEHGILGGGPASQLRGRRGVWNPHGVALVDDATKSRVGDSGIVLGRSVTCLREDESTAVGPELQFREPTVTLPVEESASAPALRGRDVLGPRGLESLQGHGTTMGEWWSRLRASVGADLSPLHWDIVRFCKAHELTQGQLQVRRDALQNVRHAVHELWPRAEVQLFGSTATGLALPWSDIDIVVLSSNDERNSTSIAWQSALSDHLRQLGQCRSLKHILHAKVPILKVVFNSGLACDISFDAHNGPNGVPVIRQFMQQHEALRPLCLVLKVFLGKHKLNEVYTGGLGSFCLINMIVGHIQKLGVSGGGHDLGVLLVSFFTRYAVMHNYRNDVVSTTVGVCASKQAKGWGSANDPELLAVEDPLDPSSDIAKASYKIRSVRKKFLKAQKLLLSLWHSENILAHLLDTLGNPTESSPRRKRKKRKRLDTVSSDENDDQSIQSRTKKKKPLLAQWQGRGSLRRGHKKHEQKAKKTRSRKENRQRAITAIQFQN